MRNLGSGMLRQQGKFTKVINYNNYARPDKRTCRCRSTDWHGRTLRTRDDILPVIEEVLRLLEAADYSRQDQFAVRLSLEEALVNAIKHGHQDDPSKEVQLRYQLTPDYFLAEIEDQGPGFKPEEVPDPFAPENLEKAGGRGLLLIRNYMTWLRFNDAGNRVTLCRRRFNA